MIKKEDGKFILYGKDGDKIGTFDTRAKAVAKQISDKMKEKEKANPPENIAGTY